MLAALLLDLTAIALLAGFLVYVRVREPPARLALPLLALPLAGILFAAGDALTNTASGLGWEWLGVVVLYLGTYSGVGLWLILAERWRSSHGQPAEGRSWLELSAWCFLGIAAVVVLTSPWSSAFITPVIGKRNVYHALWWVLAAFSYLCLLVGGLVYVSLIGEHRSASRGGAAIMALASLGLLSGNLVYVLWPSSLVVDPTLVATVLACGLTVYGIGKQGLFALRPGILPQVLEGDPDALVLMGADERPLWTNTVARTVLRLSPGRPVLSQFVDQMASTADREEIAGALRALCEREDLPGSLLLVVGETERRSYRIDAMRIQAGPDVLLMLRIRDATESERQRKEREELEQRYQRLVESAPIGILGCDREGRVVAANPRLVDFLDLSSDSQMKEGNVFELAVLREMGVTPLIRQCLDSGMPLTREIEHRSQWGRELDLGIAVEAIRDGRGETVGVMVLLEDVTEQREVERDRRKLELQRLEAQKLENLGVLAGGVAHDFNNLLQAILGNAELGLSAVEGGSALQNRLDEIRSVSLLAADIVRQLLAYAGKVQPKRENIDLSALVSDMQSLVEVGAARRCRYEHDLAEGLPAVDADPAQIRQVVLNLTMNAAEAAEPEGGLVRIVTRLENLSRDQLRSAIMGAEQLPGPRVLLEVSDNGSGMDEVTRARIFDPFFSTKVEGRGLGLATVQGILRQHDAALDVVSASGEGATFRVWFQLARAEGRMPLPILAAQESGVEIKGEGVALVIDDEEAVGKVVARGLEGSGFAVKRVDSGVAALKLLRRLEGKVRLVVVDAAMPEMSGETTARKLREIDPGVPVLLMSGSAEEDAISFTGRDLVSGFLHKPFTMIELRRAVAAVLESAPRSAGRP